MTVLDQISRPEIRRLARHARVNVVPLTLEAETAGIATIVDTFAHQRSVVTTDRPGLEDYIFPGRTALTTRPFDVASMAEALEAVWTDSNLRASLDEQAGEFARQNCTDAAAAKQLVAILDRLT